MTMAADLAAFVTDDERLELLAPSETGVVVWRVVEPDATEKLHAMLPLGSTSLTTLSSGRWLRNVAANPNFDLRAFTSALKDALHSVSTG